MARAATLTPDVELDGSYAFVKRCRELKPQHLSASTAWTVIRHVTDVVILPMQENSVLVLDARTIAANGALHRHHSSGPLQSNNAMVQ